MPGSFPPPPPQGPPPGFPPPPQGPPQGPPPGYAPPPPQGPPPSAPYGGGFGPTPPRKRRWKVVLAAVVALVLVAGIGTGAWAYFTGRLGFGPLSAADKDAAATIADGFEGPEWATDAQIRCAADDLVGEQRSGALADSGVIDKASDGWEYTGDWTDSDAHDFLASLLDCSDTNGGWAKQIGDEWGLDDTRCLDGIGSATMADYLAVKVLEQDSDAAGSAADDAVAELDDCYVTDVSVPDAKAKPGYRSVTFTFDEASVANAETTLSVDYDGSTEEIDGRTFRATTRQGGDRACIRGVVAATYPWGTSTKTDGKFCGRAEARKLFWKRLPKCNAVARACVSWRLSFAGFATGESITATLRENGGDCNSDSGDCTTTVSVGSTGRGPIVTWSSLPDWHERFTAEVDGMTAVLPN